MDLKPSSKAQETCIRTWEFIREGVIPAESEYDDYRAANEALIDKAWRQEVRTGIAAIKVAVPPVAVAVIGRAIEVFGTAGITTDTPLAYFNSRASSRRIVGSPDAVHGRTIIVREELKRPC